MRTEIEVAADVLFILRSKGLLTKTVMPDACRAVGISQNDLLAALRRSQARGDRPPPMPGSGKVGPYDPASDPTAKPGAGKVKAPVPDPDPVADPPPLRPSKPKRPPQYQGPGAPASNPTRRRERREIDGETCLLCPRCDRWLPEEANFLMRSDRNARVTHCRDCRKTYQRERRVTAKVLDEMDRVGVQFVLDEDSNLIGVACAKCGERFATDDTVEGSFAPVHAHCSS